MGMWVLSVGLVIMALGGPIGFLIGGLLFVRGIFMAHNERCDRLYREWRMEWRDEQARKHMHRPKE